MMQDKSLYIILKGKKKSDQQNKKQSGKSREHVAKSCERNGQSWTTYPIYTQTCQVDPQAMGEK